ncbi:MAG: ABC transporter substrate-binding protein [Prevotella sp.]|nr:ABC transporter substrate-binding protein [Prevotella sp.]
MKKILVLLSALLFLMSCGQSTPQGIKEEMPDDTVQLRIAILPTLDCLPICLADAHGFFEQYGLDVDVLPYQAQMDCDTAIERGWANGIVTDLVRAQRMKDNGLQLEYITATEASWQLLTNPTARIKQLRQLDDKMLAMTRFSATHLLSDKAVDSVRLKPERVFRIQVNDVNVRLGMLSAGIMDALLLPEPQATAARNQNALKLLDTHQLDYRMGVVAFSSRAATARQVEAFKKAYDMACDSINELGVHKYQDLIMKCCRVQQSTIDSLPPVIFRHSSNPRAVDIKRATDWLKMKKEPANVENQGI